MRPTKEELMSNQEKNKKRFKILTVSLWITVGFWLSMMILFFSSNSLERFGPLLILIQVINSLVYVIYLGLLVKEVNKSVITWILGTIAFSTLGIGPLVSYFNMKTIVIKNGWD